MVIEQPIEVLYADYPEGVRGVLVECKTGFYVVVGKSLDDRTRGQVVDRLARRRETARRLA
jgi:hypothetical protein